MLAAYKLYIFSSVGFIFLCVTVYLMHMSIILNFYISFGEKGTVILE